MKLELKSVSKKYKNKYVLQDFSASFSEGVYALLGPNGAGKSTLMNIIVSAIKPTEGEVIWNGKRMNGHDRVFLSQLGYLPQYMSYYPNYSGEEFLVYIAILKGLKRIEAKKKARELLLLVGLSEDANKKLRAYSGGMRQRLGIAQCLINDPKLLIFDEPTAGLDPRERIRFRNIISKLAKDRIIIISTHIVPDVDMIANQVILMRKGNQVAFESPTVLQNELNDKIWVFEEQNEEVAHIKASDIFNVTYEDGSYTYRIYSETKPCETAQRVKATLEDVYLYYFKEENKDAFAM